MFQRIRTWWAEQKASRATRAILVSPGHPVWTEANYQALAKEGYTGNVWVYAGVNQLTKACRRIPWLLFERRGARRFEIESHDALSLIRRPNREQSGSRFIEECIGFLEISGNNYIERIGPEGRPPQELHALRPDRVEIIEGSSALERISRYDYSAHGKVEPFAPENILHRRLFHPLNDWYGLSRIGVAARSVDMNNEARKWNVSLLQNRAMPAGILKTGAALSISQRKTLHDDIGDNFQGALNAGKTMVLEAGLEWQQVGLAPAEMAWLQMMNLSAVEILAILDVPPELVGLKTATYENRKEAKKAFYSDNVLPTMDAFRDDLNAWLMPLYEDGDRLELDYDRDSIDALQEERTRLWARIDAASDLTVNEKREAKGYGNIGPEGDVILVPAGMVPLQVAAQGGAVSGETSAIYPNKLSALTGADSA